MELKEIKEVFLITPFKTGQVSFSKKNNNKKLE